MKRTIESKLELQAKLDEWRNKVLDAYEYGHADTYRMIVDIDKIIANAFDHDCVIAEE